MTDAQILLNLPPDTLTVLVLGYLGYRLAYTGKDASHSAVDVVFLSLVFTLAAKVGLALADLAHPGIGIAAAPVAVLAAAVLWRKWGELAVFKILRRLQVSHSDRHQTAWETIMLRSGAMPSQLIVSNLKVGFGHALRQHALPPGLVDRRIDVADLGQRVMAGQAKKKCEQ